MIKLTEKAAKEINRIVQDQKLQEPVVLRVGVQGGGCSGFTYTMGVETQAPSQTDKTFDNDGIKIVVDMKSYLYLNGTEIDFKDTLQERGFVFNNPNAKSSCGCGSSFGV
jgi:iron-sulfur cluster assembly protein